MRRFQWAKDIYLRYRFDVIMAHDVFRDRRVEVLGRSILNLSSFMISDALVKRIGVWVVLLNTFSLLAIRYWPRCKEWSGLLGFSSFFHDRLWSCL